MRKIIVFIVTLTVAVATCSQTSVNRAHIDAAQKGGHEPFEIKQSIFFSDGFLDEYITSEWDSTYSRIDKQLRFSASGSLIEQTVFYYNGEKGFISEKQVKDVQEKLRSRVVYEYKDGYLWQERMVENTERGNQLVVTSTNEYAYDSNGNRISRIIKDRAGVHLAQTFYTYDARGNVTVSETRSPSGGVISSTRYTYDAQGNRIRQEAFNAEGNLLTTVNTVWQGGLEFRSETLTADGAMQLRITNEYGSNGELLKKTIENFQGKSTYTVQYEYVLRPRRQS